MNPRRIGLAASAATALLLSVPALAGAPKTAVIVIRHQTHGCHAWSLNGGAYVSRQVVRLAPGGSLTVTNNDLMVQELVQLRGPASAMKLERRSHMGNMPTAMHMGGKAGPYAMAHMGAMLRVTFARTGVYAFKLVDRGDYFKGIKTTGEDNELTLQVVVS
jgi:hypothetical protein